MPLETQNDESQNLENPMKRRGFLALAARWTGAAALLAAGVPACKKTADSAPPSSPELPETGTQEQLQAVLEENEEQSIEPPVQILTEEEITEKQGEFISELSEDSEAIVREMMQIKSPFQAFEFMERIVMAREYRDPQRKRKRSKAFMKVMSIMRKNGITDDPADIPKIEKILKDFGDGYLDCADFFVSNFHDKNKTHYVDISLDIISPINTDGIRNLTLGFQEEEKFPKKTAEGGRRRYKRVKQDIWLGGKHDWVKEQSIPGPPSCSTTFEKRDIRRTSLFVSPEKSGGRDWKEETHDADFHFFTTNRDLADDRLNYYSVHAGQAARVKNDRRVYLYTTEDGAICHRGGHTGTRIKDAQEHVISKSSKNGRMVWKVEQRTHNPVRADYDITNFEYDPTTKQWIEITSTAERLDTLNSKPNDRWPNTAGHIFR
ncbi:hypothetical protein HOF67_02550 [Candidatus Peregrinibacteria bacterium]|jgi:hypothetical protein|nr:hypothetical protein [Candidatus Peregrinibacteria bacterium]